ncbi:group II intron maturase-specific domain-containing protein [Arthrobacter sp. M4]|uniref:group II intron maturase-specific domain-containing protein n=1 Tax=Arthrobacter sp. M4 TaxID=218160 RepID=UPI001CDBBB18|nr:group II intron maturase-specific domain-containing protein [Arthrobacter sp. M4]MCA4131300.1 hypothetical protein [Arthrobacter sp. M4]
MPASMALVFSLAKALKRAKAPIKQLTSRKWSISMAERITLLNRFIRGWMDYFRLADAQFEDLDVRHGCVSAGLLGSRKP